MRPTGVAPAEIAVRRCGCCRFAGRAPADIGEPPQVSVSHLAEVGALVGDPARTNMLVALLRAGQLTARQLADGAGVTPQTASGHLGRMLAAGLVCMEQRGRYHMYRLGSGDVVALLTALHVAGERLWPSRRPGAHPPEDGTRFLRICREHMAGRLAVFLAETLLDGRAGLTILPSGLTLLARWGLDPLPAEAPGPQCCVDWSEGARHIGGPLGRAILTRSLALGWVRSEARAGSLTLTPAGRLGFQRRFGISLDH